VGIICIVSTAGDSIADDTELLTIVEIVRRSIEGLVDFQLSGLNGRLQQSASRRPSPRTIARHRRKIRESFPVGGGLRVAAG